MNKLNERLTLIANLSVVVGIIFFAVELQQKVRRQTVLGGAAGRR